MKANRDKTTWVYGIKSGTTAVQRNRAIEQLIRAGPVAGLKRGRVRSYTALFRTGRNEPTNES